jgi:hypothetical protein
MTNTTKVTLTEDEAFAIREIVRERIGVITKNAIDLLKCGNVKNAKYAVADLENMQMIYDKVDSAHKASRVAPSAEPAKPNDIPKGVYYSVNLNNFYDMATANSMGEYFFQRWAPYAAHFPQRRGDGTFRGASSGVLINPGDPSTEPDPHRPLSADEIARAARGVGMDRD